MLHQQRYGRCFLLLLLLNISVSLRADETAWEKYRQGEFDAAVLAFQELQKEAADREAFLNALYGEAHTWMYRSNGRNVAKAQALYEQFWREAPADHPLLPWSRFEVAQFQHVLQSAGQRDYPGIVSQYREVYTAHPGTAAGQEAWLNAMMLDVAALQPEPAVAIAAIETFLRDHPDTPWKSQCHQMMATLYQRDGKIRQQVEHLISSSETQESNVISGVLDNSGLYYQVGTIAEFQLGDFELARKYYQLFLTHYSRDNRTFTVQKAIERMDRLEQEIRAGRTSAPKDDLK